MEVNGKTRIFGIIGNPVEHTQSPTIQNSLAELVDINVGYVPFLVEDGRLEDAIKGAYALNIQGLNVTVPYKNEVIKYLVDIDEMAKNIGSVNTLVRVEGGFKGYNTDITGLMRAMRSDRVEIVGEEVIILGAGGVGRAVAFMCASAGAKKVYLLNRTVDKAKSVAEEVDSKTGVDCVIPYALSDYTQLLGDQTRKYIAIQATSVGLFPNVEDVVIEDFDFYKSLKAGYDLIYTPWETMFMQLAMVNGAKAYNGLKMLLYQGIDAFEIWNNCKIPDESTYMIYDHISDHSIRKKV
jgi:shikimate dehydrogenase